MLEIQNLDKRALMDTIREFQLHFFGEEETPENLAITEASDDFIEEVLKIRIQMKKYWV